MGQWLCVPMVLAGIVLWGTSARRTTPAGAHGTATVHAPEKTARR